MDKILTVVVPGYNVEQYIGETIESIINCANRNLLDIIIVNDGSTDNTLQIANYYAHKYPLSIRIINKQNGGHGSAINKGLEIAAGKYFIIVDGDDWVSSDILNQFLEFLQYSNTDLVITGHFKNYIHTEKEEKYFYKEETGFAADVQYLLNNKYLIPMTDICYKTAVLKNAGLKIQEHTFYVDEEYCSIPFISIHNVQFFGQGFYHYRIGDENQSISLKNTINRIDHKYRVLDKIYHTALLKCDIGPNQEYIKRKLIGIANTIFLVHYLYEKNKKKGYKDGMSFFAVIKIKYPCLTDGCYKVNKIFALMNRLCVNEPIWRKYQNIKYKVKRIML